MRDTFLLRTPAAAERLSDYLRHGTDADLRRRRGVVALSLASAGIMGIVGLYQTGLVRRLPDPPGRYFDGNRVNAAPQAYQIAGVPDALLGLVNYGATAVLAATGGPDRASRQPWLPVTLAAKATLDAAAAAKLTIDQPVKYRAACAFCLVATLLTFGVLPLVWPEARLAWRELRARRSS